MQEEKPVNPELENVASNLPPEQAGGALDKEMARKKEESKSKPPPPSSIPEPASKKTSAPTKIGKEVSKKKSNTRFLLGCAGSLLLLFVVFLV